MAEEDIRKEMDKSVQGHIFVTLFWGMNPFLWKIRLKVKTNSYIDMTDLKKVFVIAEEETYLADVLEDEIQNIFELDAQ